MRTFCLIGSGNVATHLGVALTQSDKLKCLGVMSATAKHAEALAERLRTTGVVRVEQLPADADIYILSVTDNALPGLARQLRSHISPYSVLLHTAGSISVSELSPHPHTGVFYPLQTFSRSRVLEMSDVPLFIEASSDRAKEAIDLLVSALKSKEVRETSSEERLILHLAAVFACNFTNNMLHSATVLLRKYGLNENLLHPLIEETIAKAVEMGADQSQTGPAVRADENVLSRHLSMLEEEGMTSLADVYRSVSKNIQTLSQYIKDSDE
ncbi:MAG: DUF2520 domain-containing protein [Porphyromonas sp.]|nr:DUF2520 domain-containing protein [Porphyromonas sp.]